MAAPQDLDMEQALQDLQEAEAREKWQATFGNSLLSMPCFRDSFLTGILSGVGAGLGTFMVSSRVRLATHVSMGSYVVVTAVYWFCCRYNRSLRQLEQAKFVRTIQAYQRGDLAAIAEMEKDIDFILPRTSEKKVPS